jgi:hypothetical protein
MTETVTLRRRLWLFPLIGVGIGAVLSLRASIGAGLAFVAHTTLGAPIGVLLALYPICGAVGGLLVALSFPLVRWLGGAFIVGALAMAPTFAALALIVNHSPTSEALIAGAIGGLSVGGIAGASTWFDESHRPLKLGHLWLFAAVCSVLAWIVGPHWAGEWPAAVAVLLFLIPMTLALIGTLAERHRAA